MCGARGWQRPAQASPAWACSDHDEQRCTDQRNIYEPTQPGRGWAPPPVALDSGHDRPPPPGSTNVPLSPESEGYLAVRSPAVQPHNIIYIISFIFILRHYELQERYFMNHNERRPVAHLFIKAFWSIPRFCTNLMYMRNTMHQIDSGVIIFFLKAILQKFRVCVEITLLDSLGRLQRRLRADCACSSEKKKQPAEPMRLWLPSTMQPPIYNINCIGCSPHPCL